MQNAEFSYHKNDIHFFLREYAFYNELVKYDAARAKVDLYE